MRSSRLMQRVRQKTELCRENSEGKDGKETVYIVEFGYLPVCLAEYPKTQLYLVVVRGSSEQNSIDAFVTETHEERT